MLLSVKITELFPKQVEEVCVTKPRGKAQHQHKIHHFWQNCEQKN